jgi:hypothetical protein
MEFELEINWFDIMTNVSAACLHEEDAELAEMDAESAEMDAELAEMAAKRAEWASILAKEPCFQ